MAFSSPPAGWQQESFLEASEHRSNPRTSPELRIKYQAGNESATYAVITNIYAAGHNGNRGL